VPITPDPPFPKSRNDTVRSKDWNDVVNEVIRLDTAKVDRAGDTITGPLTVDGALTAASTVTVAGALTADVGLQVGTLTAVAEGATGAGAWANLGSNAYFNGSWNRIDTTKAGVNLHMNGDGGGVEFRFMRVEADGSNQRNIAQIGAAGTSINEGSLTIDQGPLVLGGALPNQWKVQFSTTASGTDSALGALVQMNTVSATAFGAVVESAASGDGTAIGVEAIANAGGTGTAIGLYGSASGSGTGPAYGIYGVGSGNGQRYAGYFIGDVHVQGTLSKTGGGFLIDHVLDPENKTLRHNFVESPEHLCAYRGLVTLDDAGRATVTLPVYFAALTDETAATVQLTAVGDEPTAVSYRWNDDHAAFTVHGQPGAEVSWLVLAARDDPVIHLIARPVEEEKGGENLERGQFLNPEAYDRPAERGVAFAAQATVAEARAVAPVEAPKPEGIA